MDLKYLEQLASKNDPMPKYLNQPEQFYYLSMRSLYNEYRRSYISKDQADVPTESSLSRNLRER